MSLSFLSSQTLNKRAVKVGILLTLTAVFVLSVLLLLPSLTDPLQAAAVVNPPFPSITYSIQAFLWWDYNAANLHLDWVRLLVFSHVKQVFAWENIEPVEGEIDFSRADQILGEVEKRGLKLVVRLSDAPTWAHESVAGEKGVDFTDAPPDPEHVAAWVNFCGAVASRYPGRIAAYQIWNEPNLSREWGNRAPDAAEYTELLRSCSEAIRAADPAAIIISAGLSPTGTCCEDAKPDDTFLQQMYDAGFQRYADVVGMHAAGYSPPQLSPDEAEQQGSQRFFTFRRIEDLRKIMVANGDAARQAAILEFGWNVDTEGVNPSYSWYAVDENTQARYMVEAYQYAVDHWRPWVGLMSAIYIADPHWTPQDEEYWWAISGPSGWVRPAFFALANMAKTCGDRVIPARAGDSPEALGLATVVPCQ